MEKNRKKRWQINKLGIINFWYFDKEEIMLEDGKLLLRGGNGSGKSVTLQSFIPLLLDGNRSPSRLDPFGSASRKLENYMLMDDEEQERTAYLYMEMKKQNSENYITVGMGIKAQRDKPLDTWYFIVRDGKRIGKDIELLKKSPDGHIVLQKKELKNRVQETGFFTESQTKYMEKMNEIFFGFADIGNYQDLLSLIISIRAPKLSKDLKPTKMYDILNKSLKTLDEEELRGVTDAIEDMDRVSNKIEEQRRALDSVNEIGKLYEEYNRTVLSIKKIKYNEKKSNLEIESKKAEKLNFELEKIVNLIEELQNRSIELEIEQIALQDRKNLIQKDDIFWKSNEKLRIEEALESLKIETEKIRDRTSDKSESRKKKFSEIDRLERELKDIESGYQRQKSELDEQLKTLEILSLPDWNDIKLELKKFRDILNSVKKDIIEYENLKNIQERVQDDLEKNSLDLKHQHRETLRLESLVIDSAEEVKESILNWQENTEYFKLTESEQITVFDFINSSMGSSTENRKVAEIIEISEFIKERYFRIKNIYTIKLEQVKLDIHKERNIKKLTKENIPFQDLKKSIGLDILLIGEKFKDKVSKVANKDGGHFLFSDELPLLEEDGGYKIGNLLGKNPDKHNLLSEEEIIKILETLESEFGNFPSLKDLVAGRELLLQNIEIKESLEKQEEVLKNRLNDNRKVVGDLDTLIFSKIEETPIGKNSESIEYYEEIREETLENITEIIGKEKERELKKSNLLEREDEIVNLDSEIDSFNQDLKDKNREITLNEKNLISLIETLKMSGIEDILNELKISEEREKAITKELKDSNIRLGESEGKKENTSERLSEMSEKLVKLEIETKEYENFYLEELQLGYCKAENIYPEISESRVKQLEFSLNEILNRNANEIQQFRIKFRMIFQENRDSQRLNCIYTIEGKEHPLTILSEHIEKQLANLEILLTKNNIKIFEETLIETLGNKVLAEVQNSQRWIKGINELMDRIESSSSLKLELKWNPKKAETEGELDTQEITAILKNRDRISQEELTKFREHFSKKIKNALRLSRGESANCHTIVKEILDYREWFDFKLYYTKKNEKKREMTNMNFEQFSGGEKAISMYLPLLAALYARYDGTSESSPRIVAMDEAFAGVDEKNIGLLFSHLENLELDYILNSQILWGDHESIPRLAITEIIREENDRQVALINYRWNGKKLSEMEE